MLQRVVCIVVVVVAPVNVHISLIAKFVSK